MLQVLNIAKHFGAVTALKDASLIVEPGEIRALLGANGSGKSTLVKVLGGLVDPDQGQVLLDGSPVSIQSPVDSRRLGISVAYQDLSLVSRLSVAENIMLGNEPRQRGGLVSMESLQREASRVLEMLGTHIAPETLVIDLDPSTLSLVEVAKALAWKPRILILDEVTASMHHQEVQRLFALLKQLKGEGLATIFVSHRLDEVFALCDTTTVLRGGESVAALDLSEVDEAGIVYQMTGKQVQAEKREAQPSLLEAEQPPYLVVRDLVVQNRVKGVSVKAFPGEIIGIGGLVGQGQTEFLRAIYGAIPYQAGEVQVDGKAVSFRDPSSAVHNQWGFLSGDRERDGIFPDRPVSENLFLARLSLKHLVNTVSPARLRKGAQEMIEKLRVIAGSTNHPANSLSGGNQQKLIIGRWLMTNPRLLILDDPTKGVDISSRREIHDLLREMTRSGTCVLISSSDDEELLAIADRIYVFYEGQIVEELYGENRTHEQLVTSMLGVNRKKPGKVEVV